MRDRGVTSVLLDLSIAAWPVYMEVAYKITNPLLKKLVLDLVVSL